MSRGRGYPSAALVGLLVGVLVTTVAVAKIALPDSVALLLEAIVAVAAILAEVLFQGRR